MARLIYTDGEGRRREFQVGPERPEVTLGRSPRCDVVLADDTVSRHHCTVSFRAPHYWIEDRKSTAGTCVNGQWIDQVCLTDGAVIQCGGAEIRFVLDEAATFAARGVESAPAPGERPPAAASLTWLDGRGMQHTASLDATRPVVTIGRLEDCAVRIIDDSVSRNHARIRWVRDHYEVTDLESANGTWVGEQALAGSTALSDGDVVQCGAVRIHFACRDTPRRAGGAPAAALAPPRPQAPVAPPPPVAPPVRVEEARPGPPPRPVAPARPGPPVPPPMPPVPVSMASMPMPMPPPTMMPPAPPPRPMPDPSEALRRERDALASQVAELQHALAWAQHELAQYQHALATVQAENGQLRMTVDDLMRRLESYAYPRG